MMTEEYIKTNNPIILTFTAKEESRINLYKKLIQRFAGKLGYSLYKTSKFANSLEFTLVRK